MGDYAFELVDVDLSNGEPEITTIGSETIQRFIGATGLAAWLLWTEGPENPDPFDPETHPKAVVSCIGPAGERGIGIACVMTGGPDPKKREQLGI
jgi:aldehyde:ferredoxin oxidoreductase